MEIRVIERLLSGPVLAVLSIGVALVSVPLLGTDGGPMLSLISVGLYEVLGWIGPGMTVILLLRVLVEVLRHESSPTG